MAFEGLSEKLNAVFKNLRGKGRITEEDIRVIERFHDNGVSVIGLGQDGTVRVGV